MNGIYEWDIYITTMFWQKQEGQEQDEVWDL